MPPGIVGENKLEDVKVKEKHSVTLACEVIGKAVRGHRIFVVQTKHQFSVY